VGEGEEDVVVNFKGCDGGRDGTKVQGIHVA
jgi:hypothetical protein